MIVRTRAEIEAVEWGNGLSYRFLTESDDMGFTLAHTVVRAGTESPLQYRSHLEACYCIAGSGRVRTADGQVHKLIPGVIYALDKHDEHFLIADDSTDMELISVFNPPLSGDERHSLSDTESVFSQY